MKIGGVPWQKKRITVEWLLVDFQELCETAQPALLKHYSRVWREFFNSSTLFFTSLVNEKQNDSKSRCSRVWRIR